jgi:very-short-patch-repair endonuclease
MKNRIITGQYIDPEKHQKAKEMRDNPTPAEKKLWEHLNNNQIQGLHFRRQQIIDGFIVDSYCHEIGLVIEVDGGIHEKQKEYDLERESILTNRGLHLVRFKNTEVMDNNLEVIAEINRLVFDLLTKDKNTP